MKISIITINYNNLAGLQETYRSIIAQTYKDYEWIVIDGGSNQGDKAFLAEHEKDLTYWCSEPDNGVYNAQNKGILHAGGDYMIFMNSGDTFYDANVLSTVFSQFPSADVLYGDWVQRFDDGREVMMNAPHIFSLHFIYSDNICHQAMFIKTSILQRYPYDEDFKYYADWAKWIELSLKKIKFQYVPYTICVFMMGGMSQAMTMAQRKAEREKLRSKIIPQAVKETLEYLSVLQGKRYHRLALETDRLIKKKVLYRKIIHMAIRFVHLLEKVLDH